jgi:hypothetical protein
MLMVMPAMTTPEPTVHPPAQEAQEFEEDHHHKEEEQKAEEAADKANAVAAPPVHPIAGIAAARRSVGRHRFGLFTAVGQETGHIAFIPPRLPDAAANSAKEQDAHQPRQYQQDDRLPVELFQTFQHCFLSLKLGQ